MYTKLSGIKWKVVILLGFGLIAIFTIIQIQTTANEFHYNLFEISENTSVVRLNVTVDFLNETVENNYTINCPILSPYLSKTRTFYLNEMRPYLCV